MFFTWFKQQKEIVYPNPGAQIEVEFAREDKSESGFSKLLKFEKKRFSLSLPVSDDKELAVYMGDPALLLWLSQDHILSCRAEVLETGGSHIGLKRTANIVTTPRKVNSDLSFEIAVPVHFRSLSTTHLQTATSNNFTREGLEMITNLPIPAKTELYIEIKIPNSPVLKFRGSVKESNQFAPGEKKYLTFVEFDTPEPEDYHLLLKYLDFYQHRLERQNDKKVI